MIKRNTIQRTLILETIRNLKNHPTADEVYETIVNDHPNISRGTVYRNLNQLSEDGIIKRIPIPGAAEHFDHLVHNHYHARCLDCGNIYDVQMENLPVLEDLITDKKGFVFTGYDILFKGTCHHCSHKN